MGRIDELEAKYRRHIGAPWQRNLAGDQKTIFVVYPNEDERRLRARLVLFEMATTRAGHSWWSVDLTDAFARWMSDLDYRERFFERPRLLKMPLRDSLVPFAVERVKSALNAEGADEDSVVAVVGASTLFGFVHLSEILNLVKDCVRGRLLVFFPGEHEDNNYRLLGARDGWNYLAAPITLHDGVN